MTVLIGVRIWWVDHKTAGLLRSRTLKPIANIIIESGALYSASLLILLIMFLKKSWAKPIMVDLVVQIIVSCLLSCFTFVNMRISCY